MFLRRSVLTSAGMLAGGKRTVARAVGAQPPVQLRRLKSTAVDTDEVVRVHACMEGGTGLDTVQARPTAAGVDGGCRARHTTPHQSTDTPVD